MSLKYCLKTKPETKLNKYNIKYFLSISSSSGCSLFFRKVNQVFFFMLLCIKIDLPKFRDWFNWILIVQEQFSSMWIYTKNCLPLLRFATLPLIADALTISG